MSRLKGMQFAFISHSQKVCSCHNTVFFCVESLKPQPLLVLQNRTKVCHSSQSQYPCCVLLFYFFIFWACFLYALPCHWFTLPLLRVSSARPHLSLYSVTYCIQGESSYRLSEIFQTGLSLLISVCGVGKPQNYVIYLHHFLSRSHSSARLSAL